MKRNLTPTHFTFAVAGRMRRECRRGSYQQITQEEAKEMMDSQEVIILDVREQDEYGRSSAMKS